MIKFNIPIGDTISGLSDLLYEDYIITTDEKEAELIGFKLQLKQWPIMVYHITYDDEPIAQISVKHLDDGKLEIAEFQIYENALGKSFPLS